MNNLSNTTSRWLIAHNPGNGMPKDHLAVLSLLVAFGCLVQVNSSAVLDTARDVYNAWQISSGSSFPLEGPILAGVIHSGPAWFYILSIPLLLSSSWIVMSLWVGLLTGMKYVLAYACGRQLGSRRFGLIWACLLAFPNWSALNYLIFTHVNLVETAFLLCLYSFIRWQKDSSTNWFFMLCLAVGLGIHAHPSVYAAGLAALPMIAWALWRRQIKPWHVLVGALLALTPMIPYLVSQQLQAWPDLQSSREYMTTQHMGQNLLGFMDMTLGALIDGPWVALRYVLGLQGYALTGACLALALTGVIGLLLLANSALRNGLPAAARILLASSLLVIACVALIRDFTPYYMTLVIYPPVYGLVAWGWSQPGGRLARPVSYLFSLAALVSLAGFALATLKMGETGHLDVAYKSALDVRSRARNELQDGIFYPGWGRETWGNFICQQQQPVYFHGFSSVLLEQNYALEARMRCSTDGVFIGGKGPGRHYLGLSRWDAEQLQLATELTMGSLAFYEARQVLGPEQPVAIPIGDVYPPRKFLHSGSREATLEFTMDRDEILAITNLYHFWMPYSFEVRLNGQPAMPLAQSTVTSYFACRDCPDTKALNWSVTISAPQPQWVELVTFRPKRKGSQAVQ